MIGIKRTLLLFCGLVLMNLSMADSSWAEADWSDPISIDHAGFSDGTDIMSLGKYQIESGIKFTSKTTSTNWLSQYGLFDWLELRFKVPAMMTFFATPGVFQIDSLEAGPKIRVLNKERVQIAVVPYAIFPTGSSVSSGKIISFGVELLTDISLSDAFTASLSAYPRLLGQHDAPTDDYSYDSDAAFAVALSWSATRQFSIAADAWTKMSKSTTSDKFEFAPAADLVITYLFTPNVAVDVSAGTSLDAPSTSMFGGFGLSVRL